MEEAELYAELTPIFRDVLTCDDLDLRPDLTASDVTGWDSFKQIELVIAIQEKFHIKFTARDIDSLHRVSDLVRIILAKGLSTK
jgi:acyl carrier protein